MANSCWWYTISTMKTATKVKAITIYSTPTCHFCHMAKDFFNEHGVKYEEVNVAADRNRLIEMVQKSGQRGVPVIDIGGEVIVGYDQPRIAGALGL